MLSGALREKKLIRRVIVWAAGLFILSFGVALSINAALGVSPVTSLGYVLSLIDLSARGDAALSTGTFVNITFCFLILIQIAILRKKFKWINLAQLLSSTVFGWLVDLTRWIIGDFTLAAYFGERTIFSIGNFVVSTGYLGQLLMLAASIVIIALGIIIFVDAKMINLPMEGLIVTITEVSQKAKFHIVKIIADSALVAMGIIFSLIFLGYLSGIREGTVIAAIFVGKVMPFVRKIAVPVLNRVGIYEKVS